MDAKTIFEKLSAPFTKVTPDGKTVPAHKWRAVASGNVMIYAAYIDARQVRQRLNEVFGIDGWSNTNTDVNGATECSITAKIGDEFVTRSDVGTETKVEAKKGAASDAIKRAAVGFGVGAYLYEIPNKKLNTQSYKGKKYPCTNGSNPKILWTADDVNAYLNTYSTPQGLIMELTRVCPEIKETHDKELMEIFKACSLNTEEGK